MSHGAKMYYTLLGFFLEAGLDISRRSNMDLERKVKILPTPRPTSSADAIQEPTQVSIFEAVRRWTDDEGMGTFDIELDGRNLTPEQIQEIAHSEDYKARLLAF